ncbi:hypothetical protein Rhe02_37990 [Rhizocola hellebori]|uniref:Uncharacterized protein n=1 Tax=Rhizocola hellebori TaxID=1392758 RepID=A0A8J3Q9C5_9ACTN|nr:hypothetical protein Rhe02_37990 [Rhizocola hellebori]
MIIHIDQANRRAPNADPRRHRAANNVQAGLGAAAKQLAWHDAVTYDTRRRNATQTLSRTKVYQDTYAELKPIYS